MPRFALLLHDSPRGWHCDFFLEAGDVLRTWALPSLPEPGQELICTALSDHRLLYLDYEGFISGDRGTVTRWDGGSFALESAGEDHWSVELRGERLRGRVTIDRLPETSDTWRFCWHANL